LLICDDNLEVCAVLAEHIYQEASVNH